jgi:hypothetical protein
MEIHFKEEELTVNVENSTCESPQGRKSRLTQPLATVFLLIFNHLIVLLAVLLEKSVFLIAANIIFATALSAVLYFIARGGKRYEKPDRMRSILPRTIPCEALPPLNPQPEERPPRVIHPRDPPFDFVLDNVPAKNPKS